MSNTVNIVCKDQPQFRGVFRMTWRIEATVDLPSIAANSNVAETLTIPGLNPLKDIMLGFNDLNEEHAFIVNAHIHTNEIHLVVHNTSGGAIDPAAANFLFFIGRLC